MADVLISSAAADQAQAEELARLFADRGFTVDYLSLEPSEPGYREAIQARRASARATLALWSEHSVKDAAVIEGAREGLRRNALLSARLDESQPPPELRTIFNANLIGWNGATDHVEVARLVAELRKILDRTATRPALAMTAARLAGGGSMGGGKALAYARNDPPPPRPLVQPAPVQAAQPATALQTQPAPQIFETKALEIKAEPVTAAAAPLEQNEPDPSAFLVPLGYDDTPAPAEPTAKTGGPVSPPVEAKAPEAKQPEAKPAEPPRPRSVAPAAFTPAPAVERRRTPPLAPNGARSRADRATRVWAWVLGVAAGAAALALWFGMRPEDFKPAQKPAAALESAASEDRVVNTQSLAEAGPAKPSVIATPQTTPIKPVELAALPAPIPAPKAAAPIPPAARPVEPVAVATPPMAAKPVAAKPIVTPPAPAPKLALAPAPPAAKPTPKLVETKSILAAAQPAPTKAAAAPAQPIAPRLTPPAPSAQKLAVLGEKLDAAARRATAPATVKQAALKKPAAPRPPRAIVAANGERALAGAPSQTALSLPLDPTPFRLPNLAPSGLALWAPPAETPAPLLTPVAVQAGAAKVLPISALDWGAASSRSLAQTALLDGAYADHLGWAEAGSMDSMTALGLMRQTGIGAERDDAKAFAWLRRAALRDHPRALAELGAYYAAGKATARDDKRALELFQRSAEFGSAAGRTGLGWAYLTGRGTAADPTQARQLFEAAAAEGDPVAALNLGRLYADGMGVARDETEAASWYAKAADQGSASAQYALALMLLERRTADPQNATLAAGRLQQAAAQGHPEAQRLLGALYAAGLGVPKDRATAQAWYDRAVAQTVSPATREAAGRALITLRTSS